VPEFVIPSNWDFRLEETADGFFAATNYRFDELTSRYRKRIPDGEITAAFILSNMMEARAEITFAAKHISELVTDPISSALLRQQFELTAEKAAESAQEISSFQDMILSGKTLAEAINSGERTFSEFLTLLDKARRFKEWLKGAHPEKGLLSEYYKATTSKTWIDTLAGKSIRFCLVTAGGAIAGLAGGVAAELGVGVADAFLTDKIAIGWKPNHFVENHLTTFVTPTL
jgi:hypothetical protein